MQGIKLILVLFLFLTACVDFPGAKKRNNEADKYELLDADKAFASLCREKGFKAAFIEYIDSNGVILPPGLLPREGASAIDYLISQDDSEYSMTWKPRDGTIASSGDLGYTYGIYSLQMKGSEIPLTGTYVAVWKKQGDGKWKFILYSGQEARND